METFVKSNKNEEAFGAVATVVLFLVTDIIVAVTKAIVVGAALWILGLF